jgi:hypothetical protein
MLQKKARHAGFALFTVYEAEIKTEAHAYPERMLQLAHAPRNNNKLWRLEHRVAVADNAECLGGGVDTGAVSGIQGDAKLHAGR